MLTLNTFLDSRPQRASLPMALRLPEHNEWGGVDYEAHDGGTVRVVPTDGEWEAGITVYRFDRHYCLTASAVFQGVPARTVWEVVEALEKE